MAGPAAIADRIPAGFRHGRGPVGLGPRRFGFDHRLFGCGPELTPWPWAPWTAADRVSATGPWAGRLSRRRRASVSSARCEIFRHAPWGFPPASVGFRPCAVGLRPCALGLGPFARLVCPVPLLPRLESRALLVARDLVLRARILVIAAGPPVALAIRRTRVRRLRAAPRARLPATPTTGRARTTASVTSGCVRCSCLQRRQQIFALRRARNAVGVAPVNDDPEAHDAPWALSAAPVASAFR